MVILRATQSLFLIHRTVCPCRGIQKYGHKKQEPNFLFALNLVVHSIRAGANI